jgi:hypothetical protein
VPVPPWVIDKRHYLGCLPPGERVLAIRRALLQAGGSPVRACEILSCSRNLLRWWCHVHGIEGEGAQIRERVRRRFAAPAA